MVDLFSHAVLILHPSTFPPFWVHVLLFSTAMMLGYQASDSGNAYDFFGFFFSIRPTDRPTQYQERHSTVNEKKKKKKNGDGLKASPTFFCD